MYVINEHVIVFNTIYAKGEGSVSFNDICCFANILYTKLIENNIMFITENYSNAYVNIHNHKYLKLEEKVNAINEVDIEFIEYINSLYGNDIQRLIDESREEYKDLCENALKR